MAIYLKKFSTHAEYEAYIASEDKVLPNVSICTTEGDVHYNPYVEPVETRVVAKYNVTSKSSPTQILFTQKNPYNPMYDIDGTSGFSAIEIDGVFDDCQALVKSAFMDEELNKHLKLTSANSINVARFLPQAFYYFARQRRQLLPWLFPTVHTSRLLWIHGYLSHSNTVQFLQPLL